MRLGIVAFLLVALSTSRLSHANDELPFNRLEYGNDHGLTDLNGKELLPPIYAGIRHVGHGLFLLKQRIPDKRFDCAKEKILLNSRLVKLKTPVPAGTTFERIMWLGKRADKSDDLIGLRLPEDALLVNQADKYFGVCDSKGRQILPPDCIWIGNLCDGIAALRKSDGLLYTFNFKTRKLHKLFFQKVRQDCRLDFCEGLAAFATEPSPQSPSMWGFMDTNGNAIIEPKFDFAWNFVEGLACVRFPARGFSDPAHNELIDKTGKLVSLPNLKVVMTFGRYIEVADSSGSCGVVDRRFKFVIPPKYQSIHAQVTHPDAVDEIGIWPRSAPIPIFYFATRKADGKSVILSAKGDLVLEVPSNLISHDSRSQPIFMDGVFACNRGPGVPLSKATFINFKGEIVPAPYSNLSDSDDVRFGKIASGVLLKTVQWSKVLRDRARDKNLPEDLSSKERTLRQYACDALTEAVIDFENGNFTGALLKLQNAKLDERRDPLYQPVFIRGLCLQAMGNFAEAAGDYATVNRSSNDQLLKTKSKIGLECCSKKQSSIPPEMVTFPPRWEREGFVEIPLPRRR